jgi:hypothetical protein
VKAVEIDTTGASYGVQDAVDVFIDLVIPASNDAPAVGFQPCGPSIVRDLRRRVLAAIELDSERVIGTNEIRNEVTKRDLAAEFQSEQAAIAQSRPQALFDVGLVCAQAARRGNGHAPA